MPSQLFDTTALTPAVTYPIQPVIKPGRVVVPAEEELICGISGEKINIGDMISRLDGKWVLDAARS